MNIKNNIMNKIFYLSSCNTCQRIMDGLEGIADFEKQDIKQQNISEQELDFVAKLNGGYEAVFSKRAMKYRSLGLNEMTLSEADYKKYILEEYTFLKRPVFIIGDQAFAGNSKKVVASIQEAINK